jgi:hypothetical protein
MSMGNVIGLALALFAAVGVYTVIGYGVWRLARMKPSPDTFVTHARATRALLKFCVDHQRGPDTGTGIVAIQECLHALENGDVQAAVKHYRSIHFGPYGFDDWFPPVVFEHEDGEYVWTVFQGLCGNWARLMELLRKEYRLP